MADEGWTAGPKGFCRRERVERWPYVYVRRAKRPGLGGSRGCWRAGGFQDSQNPNQAIGFVRAFGGIWIGMGDEGHESKQTTVGGGALFTRAFTQEGKTDETRQKQRDD